MVVIKVTERNTLVLSNVSYCQFDYVSSLMNIDDISIALCRKNEIKIYNKKYKKRQNCIKKSKESSEHAIWA